MSAAALATVLLAGCGGDPAASKRPNVQSEVVLKDIEGHSNTYALAYGVGLRAGCNPKEFLDASGELKPNTRAQEIFAKAQSQGPPQEAVDGLKAGTQRGLAEYQDPLSEVC